MVQKDPKDTLLPAYLILGEDELKRATVLKRLKMRMEKLGDLSFNHVIFLGEQATGLSIVSACNTIPFASEKRLVQVEKVDKLKKPDADALADYLSSPASTTVLALFADTLPKNSRLYKSVSSLGKQSIIECPPLKKYELIKMVRSTAESYGVRITDGAAQTLIDLVGENTVFLESEVKKISLSHNGTDAITDHEVKALVSRNAEPKPWEFVDAFSSRNIDKTVTLFSQMSSTSPHALLALCTARVRELICAHSLYRRGNESELSSLLKMQPWRVKNHMMWARNFEVQELIDAIISSRDAEKKMKGGANPGEEFLMWSLAVMQGKER